MMAKAMTILNALARKELFSHAASPSLNKMVMLTPIDAPNARKVCRPNFKKRIIPLLTGLQISSGLIEPSTLSYAIPSACFQLCSLGPGSRILINSLSRHLIPLK